MSDDDTYEIPLQDQRVFGAGIKRKRVKFVPSSTQSTVLPSSNTPAKSISDFYLGLVLPKEIANTGEAPPTPDTQQLCEICSLLLATALANVTNTEETQSSRPHEASLAHQLCITHSHPPSHLDRNRKGVSILASYGFDLDARVGLGKSGQGIQFPITAKPKEDKMGIGLVLPKEAERRKKEKPTKLDAGKVRKMHEKDKKRMVKLQKMFYQNDDVERYLGGG